MNKKYYFFKNDNPYKSIKQNTIFMRNLLNNISKDDYSTKYLTEKPPIEFY
jgi:hypothetical protein